LPTWGIINGRAADPRVGKAAVFFFDEETQASCSGVVVHPRLIVTAGHCLVHAKKENLTFSNATRAFSSRSRLPVAQIIVHDDYKGASNGMQTVSASSEDIGLIVMSQPILQKLGLTPADLPPVVQGTDEFTPPLRIVGYGYESRDAQADTASRRELLVSATVDTTRPGTMKLSSEEAKKTPCFGDSGSGVFADDGHTARVVAVVCSIKPGGALKAKFDAETAKQTQRAEEKRQKKIASNLKKGITVDVPLDPIKISDSLKSQVCGDKDTITQAVPVSRQLCWIQKMTQISLVSGLQCSGASK